MLPLLQVGASLRMEPEGRWWEDAFQGVISKLQPEVCCRATGWQCARHACTFLALKQPQITSLHALASRPNSGQRCQ